MRRMMIVFGLLDLSIVATYALRIPAEVRGLVTQPWLNALCLLMMASLVISGYGLLRGRHWALVVNYVQFPFRIALAFLSFAWLVELVLPSHPSVQVHQAAWISAVALEGLRLGLTIMLHYGGVAQILESVRRS